MQCEEQDVTYEELTMSYIAIQSVEFNICNMFFPCPQYFSVC